MAGHPHIERWSLLMHGVIADLMEAGDQAPLRKARENLERWQRQGSLSSAQAEWLPILSWPTPRLIALLRAEEDENAVRLRSNSPFSGILTDRMRMELLREARAA